METYTFEPDKELLDFADYFSKNYKTLPIGITLEGSGGDYFSDNKKYHIKYVDKIIDITGHEPKTDVRIGHTTKVIEVSKSFLDTFENNSDYLFFVILWCIVKVESKERNDSKADITTMEYYMKTGRSVKNVLVCFVAVLQRVNHSEAHQRIKALLEFTNKNN